MCYFVSGGAGKPSLHLEVNFLPTHVFEHKRQFSMFHRHEEITLLVPYLYSGSCIFHILTLCAFHVIT